MKNFLEKFIILAFIFSLISYYGFMSSFGLSSEVLGLSSGFGVIFGFTLIQGLILLAIELWWVILLYIGATTLLYYGLKRIKQPKWIHVSLKVVRNYIKKEKTGKEYFIFVVIVMFAAFYIGNCIANIRTTREVVPAQCISLFEQGYYLIPDISGGERIVLIPLDHEYRNNYKLGNSYIIKGVADLNCSIQKVEMNILNLK